MIHAKLETTLEAVLNGAITVSNKASQEMQATIRRLRDPFQNAVPCWQEVYSANDPGERLESLGHADGQIINTYRRLNRRDMKLAR